MGFKESVPTDRGYSKLALEALEIEAGLFAETRVRGVSRNTLVIKLGKRIAELDEEAGKKPRNINWRATRALDALLKRGTDLIAGTNEKGQPTVERVPGYLVASEPPAGGSRAHRSGITGLDPLQPRGERLAARIKDTAKIVAEEQQRIDGGGLMAEVTAWEMNMLLAVIGPRLAGDMVVLIRKARAEQEVDDLV